MIPIIPPLGMTEIGDGMMVSMAPSVPVSAAQKKPKKRNPHVWWKVVVWLLCLAPAAWLVYGLFTNNLGANPVEKITHETGEWTLKLVLATLLITPLRRTIKYPDLIKYRRLVGLFAFFYGCLHFLTWFILDKTFDFSQMWADVIKRRFITVGMLAFVLMIPLTITSTQGWIRRLGKKWQKLHRLVYVTAIAGVIHWYWLVKSDIREPVMYGLALVTLFGWRWYVTRA